MSLRLLQQCCHTVACCIMPPLLFQPQGERERSVLSEASVQNAACSIQHRCAKSHSAHRKPHSALAASAKLHCAYRMLYVACCMPSVECVIWMDVACCISCFVCRTSCAVCIRPSGWLVDVASVRSGPRLTRLGLRTASCHPFPVAVVVVTQPYQPSRAEPSRVSAMSGATVAV